MTAIDIQLTATEKEQARTQAQKVMQQRLDARRPDPSQYAVGQQRAAQLITSILSWSKVFVPVIALLAALASSVRTVQTASEIYIASGSHPIGVALAAFGFTVAVEGALFFLALASEGERLRLRTERQQRHVTSLRSIWYGILVRIGVREPLRHDQLPEHIRLGPVMLIAFLFAVAANAFMGLRPLLREIGNVSLQTFFADLASAPATLQLTFIVDIAGILFPPLMALAAGHLTARFASEIIQQSSAVENTYQTDLERWREVYANPLETEEGRELVEMYMDDKLRAKLAKQLRAEKVVDFLATGTERLMD